MKTKSNISKSPQCIENGHWLDSKKSYFYEDSKKIIVCIWDQGKYTETTIPWNKLIKSAKRCGKI